MAKAKKTSKVGRPRIFTDKQIAAIVAEAEQNGALLEDVCRKHGVSVVTVWKWRKRHGKEPFKPGRPPGPPKPVLSAEQVVDIEREKIRAKQAGLAQRVKVLTERNLVLEKELEAATAIMQHDVALIDIPVDEPSGKSVSAAVSVLSDWHVEEKVIPSVVGGLNEYNLEIAKQRAMKVFQKTDRFIKMLGRDTNIRTLIVGALGDFITNRIHEDLAESNYLPPTDAILYAQQMLVSGFDFLLHNIDKSIKINVVCHSGNHGRLTVKQRGTTEAGNSLERYMYCNLAQIFRNEPRIQFTVNEGYYSLVRLFGGKYVMRMHHGHVIKYQGGIGGPTIPILKALASWNTAENVDLDVFGHLHWYNDHTRFVSNGSLIGRNDFAVRIKAPFEKPSQSFFLINKNHNTKSIVAPVFC